MEEATWYHLATSKARWYHVASSKEARGYIFAHVAPKNTPHRDYRDKLHDDRDWTLERKQKSVALKKDLCTRAHSVYEGTCVKIDKTGKYKFENRTLGLERHTQKCASENNIGIIKVSFFSLPDYPHNTYL